MPGHFADSQTLIVRIKLILCRWNCLTLITRKNIARDITAFTFLMSLILHRDFEKIIKFRNLEIYNANLSSIYSVASHWWFSHLSRIHFVDNSILVSTKLYIAIISRNRRKDFRVVHYLRNLGPIIHFLTRSLIWAIQSVGQSILFEGNVLTNKGGNLPPRRRSQSGGSSIESRELGHDSSRVDCI